MKNITEMSDQDSWRRKEYLRCRMIGIHIEKYVPIIEIAG